VRFVIRSMTGFGRSSFEVEQVDFSVEVRTLNHRHLDLSIRLPRFLGDREPGIKKRLQGRFGRGKVEISISLGSGSSVNTQLEVDLDLAEQYVGAAEALQRAEGVGGSLDVAALLALPGVSRLVEHEFEAEDLDEGLFAAIDEAAAAAEAMRVAEGGLLERELRGRLELTASLVEEVESRSSSVQEAVRERLRKRTEQLRQETGLIDEARLHQEIVIAADRLDVSEELARLRSHIEQFKSALESSEAGSPVGRRLDFLLQEMGREANTLGSKGSNAPIAHRVIDLKTELERIREQVQNVE
jgi:uncharacterized protein (TIGR00255 family)